MSPSETVVPPGPAGPLKVTVPVLDVPPGTELGDSETDCKVAGLTVRFAVLFRLLSVTVMVAWVWAFTAFVETWNVAELEPSATFTIAGTVADGSELATATLVPPEPAGPLKVKVAVALEPPITEIGLRLSELRVAGSTVRMAVFVTAPRVAVIVAMLCEFTPTVDMLNVAVF